MNSGFRWPYGRREGVLPVWAHRRAAAPDAERFPRIIFQDRTSEGWASRSSADFSRDDYFCLSFDRDTTTREALDAVSCASVFNSDKGRYLTEEDVAGGYAEPWEEPDGDAYMRSLAPGSLYPPRRDVERCTAAGCNDHPDVASFAEDARRVMPDIDAVTMATPRGDAEKRIDFDIPAEWPGGDYVAYVEINVEGDYNSEFNASTHPTPTQPSGQWDSWAIRYGYPYRGQPSVVYSVPFSLDGPGVYTTAQPTGYADVHGADGEMSPMAAGGVVNDPEDAPGSGADRLTFMDDGSRLRLEVVATNVCSSPDPPPECGAACSDASPCPSGFVCAPDGECVGYCDIDMMPEPVSGLDVSQHPDEKQSHQWARMTFRVPESDREITRYEVRVSNHPIVDAETFMRAPPANAASLDSVELVVPTDGSAGEEVEVDLGGLLPEVRYWVAIRAVDSCNDRGPIEVAEVVTTEIHFTTVSPCFVATAAYGTPMADDIGTLRRFRDRHLLTNAPGRALVDAYHAVGPHAADVIRESELLRAAARSSLGPWVALAGLVE